MNHGWTYIDKITSGNSGISALAYYSGNYRHSTLERWNERLENGEVTSGDKIVKPNTILSNGDILKWHRPPWDEPSVPTSFKIIYEDDELVAIDKPAGLPVVPDGGFLENTLVHLLSKHYPNENIVPAHRLNRGTSGLIICGRTKNARENLAAQFRDKTGKQNGDMIKTYHAISQPYKNGKLGDIIEIETPIGPVNHPIIGQVHAASSLGKPSKTECKIIKTDNNETHWCINLITGRPHQIRIHLASIGVPLIGEPLFLPGGKPNPAALPGDCGYYLRSTSLQFRHPKTDRRIKISVND